jgi:hypothetical protein
MPSFNQGARRAALSFCSPACMLMLVRSASGPRRHWVTGGSPGTLRAGAEFWLLTALECMWPALHSAIGNGGLHHQRRPAAVHALDGWCRSPALPAAPTLTLCSTSRLHSRPLVRFVLIGQSTCQGCPCCCPIVYITARLRSAPAPITLTAIIKC